MDNIRLPPATLSRNATLEEIQEALVYHQNQTRVGRNMLNTRKGYPPNSHPKLSLRKAESNVAPNNVPDLNTSVQVVMAYASNHDSNSGIRYNNRKLVPALKEHLRLNPRFASDYVGLARSFLAQHFGCDILEIGKDETYSDLHFKRVSDFFETSGDPFLATVYKCRSEVGNVFLDNPVPDVLRKTSDPTVIYDHLLDMDTEDFLALSTALIQRLNEIHKGLVILSGTTKDIVAVSSSNRGFVIFPKSQVLVERRKRFDLQHAFDSRAVLHGLAEANLEDARTRIETLTIELAEARAVAANYQTVWEEYEPFYFEGRVNNALYEHQEVFVDCVANVGSRLTDKDRRRLATFRAEFRYKDTVINGEIYEGTNLTIDETEAAHYGSVQTFGNLDPGPRLFERSVAKAKEKIKKVKGIYGVAATIAGRVNAIPKKLKKIQNKLGNGGYPMWVKTIRALDKVADITFGVPETSVPEISVPAVVDAEHIVNKPLDLPAGEPVTKRTPTYLNLTSGYDRVTHMDNLLKNSTSRSRILLVTASDTVNINVIADAIDPYSRKLGINTDAWAKVAGSMIRALSRDQSFHAVNLFPLLSVHPEDLGEIWYRLIAGDINSALLRHPTENIPIAEHVELVIPDNDPLSSAIVKSARDVYASYLGTNFEWLITTVPIPVRDGKTKALMATLGFTKIFHRAELGGDQEIPVVIEPTDDRELIVANNMFEVHEYVRTGGYPPGGAN